MEEALKLIFINIIDKEGDVKLDNEMFSFKNCLLASIREGVGKDTFQEWLDTLRVTKNK